MSTKASAIKPAFTCPDCGRGYVAEKNLSRHIRTNHAAPAPATKADRGTLGTFTPTGTDGETHKCSGKCGLRLPIKKFPTTKTSGVRVSECRSCRDTRTEAVAKGRSTK